MKTLEPKDIPDCAAYGPALVSLGSGLYVRIECKQDDSMEAPWEEHDGHGEVSDWTARSKRAGERVINSDGGCNRYYDIAATMKKAKAEGWGLGEKEAAALAAKLDRTPTAREIMAAAVESDFEFCRSWCADEWHWIGVCVTLEDSDGKELGTDSVWGIESNSDYWKEVALDLVEQLASKHSAEQAEREHWENRDTVTTL